MRREKLYFEISKERIHEQVYNNERRENGVQDTHEYETSSEPEVTLTNVLR